MTRSLLGVLVLLAACGAEPRQLATLELLPAPGADGSAAVAPLPGQVVGDAQALALQDAASPAQPDAATSPTDDAGQAPGDAQVPGQDAWQDAGLPPTPDAGPQQIPAYVKWSCTTTVQGERRTYSGHRDLGTIVVGCGSNSSATYALGTPGAQTLLCYSARTAGLPPGHWVYERLAGLRVHYVPDAPPPLPATTGTFVDRDDTVPASCLCGTSADGHTWAPATLAEVFSGW